MLNLNSRLKKLEIISVNDPARCKHPDEAVQWIVAPLFTTMHCKRCNYYGWSPDDRPQPFNESFGEHAAYGMTEDRWQDLLATPEGRQTYNEYLRQAPDHQEEAVYAA